MSTLTDRRKHRVPRGWVPAPTAGPWRDFAATVIFAMFGLGVTLAELIAEITADLP